MSNQTIRAQYDKPEDAILAFSKELAQYVDAMSRMFLQLKTENAEMHDFWRGEQYEKFSRFLETSVGDAAKQLKVLHALQSDLSKKALLLREARNL